MTTKYPFIPEHLEKGLEDVTIPLIDLMHGHLKVEMLDLEQQIELVKDGNYHIESQDYLEGYMEALTNMYCMTYNLSIERKHIEETLV
jgi:hypothetical protein